MDQVTILTGGNGDITDVLSRAPKECVLVITVVCYEVMESVSANWGIGGISIDGSWSVDGMFTSTIKHNPVLDEVLVFKFDIDEIRDNAIGDIQINYYNGYRVLTAVIGSKYDTYKLPTPTPTPSPTLTPTPAPTAMPIPTVSVKVPSGVKISEENFPDPYFRECARSFDTDYDESLSEDEIKAAKIIKLSSYSTYDHRIKTLKGIEYFVYLEELHCQAHDLSDLNLSQNPYLRILNCHDNTGLTSLDVSKNHRLETLDCSYCNLYELDLSQNPALVSFTCSYNNISTLNLGVTPELTGLTCSSNRISVLNIANAPKLKHLSCDDNRLSELDISNNRKLVSVKCSLNRLTSLDASNHKSLERLSCNSNQISIIDITGCDLLYYFHHDVGVEVIGAQRAEYS